VRSQNAKGWGEWSPEATGGRGARVHGCPSVYDLEWDNATDETITITWEPYTPGREASGCSSEFSYELEYREPGTGQQWFEAYPSDINFTDSIFTRDELKPCTSYDFRGRGKNALCPGRYSDNLRVDTNCPQELPAQSERPLTVATNEGIQIFWGYAESTGASEAYECEVQIEMPSGQFRGVQEECDCSDQSVFETSTCQLSYLYL
jgi:hypothetical protein